MDLTDFSVEERRRVNIIIGTDLEEASKVLPLARLGHKESYFADLDFDEQAYLNLCRAAKESPADHGALYVEYDGEPAACAFYMMRAMMGSQKHPVTMVHAIYLRADMRATPIGGAIWKRMVSVIRGWGAVRNACGVMFNVATGIAVAESDAVLRASGAVYLGGNYFLR